VTKHIQRAASLLKPRFFPVYNIVSIENNEICRDFPFFEEIPSPSRSRVEYQPKPSVGKFQKEEEGKEENVKEKYK
jgi:hypothetical protein